MTTIPPIKDCLYGGNAATCWRQCRQKRLSKMTQARPKPADNSPQLMRRGHVVYDHNPSLSEAFPTRIRASKPTKVGDAYMVAPGTGEVVSRGAFGFIEEKEIDSEQFVKIYLAGIRQYGELSKAGALLFEFVYKELSGSTAKDKDTIALNYLLANRWKNDLSKRTYERGMNELLEKEFLYRSLAAELYFVNVRFMFNGDRMVLVQSYRRKGAPKISSAQAELPLGGSAAVENKGLG